MNVRGIIRTTWAQDQWNQHTDYIEENDEGTITGLWCDYYEGGTTPAEETDSGNIHSVITYVGKPTIKAGGSYKKFTVTFYDGEEAIDFITGQWSFEIDGTDASSLVATDNADVEQNQIKVKFTGSEDYMGKTLKVVYSSDTGIVSSVDILIAGA